MDLFALAQSLCGVPVSLQQYSLALHPLFTTDGFLSDRIFIICSSSGFFINVFWIF